MRNYELVLLLDSAVSEPKKWQEKIKKWLGSGAEIKKAENWGRKKLAYPIKKKEEAIYLFYLLAADPLALKTLEAKLRLEDKILRYLLIKNT